MISKVAISIVCFALSCSAAAQAQLIPQGLEPQPMPGAPNPDFTAPRGFPRARPQVPPSTTAPTQRARGPAAIGQRPAGSGPNGPAVVAPGPAGPRQPTLSVYAPVTGLSEPIDDLMDDIGYQAGKTVPLTPQTCFDLAYACYADGRFADAMIFASHGLRMCNDARLYLIKGVCELHRGLNSAAEQTAGEFRSAMANQQFFGIEAARERINDARAVRFANIVEYQATGH
jgi:hypothetical protein